MSSQDAIFVLITVLVIFKLGKTEILIKHTMVKHRIQKTFTYFLNSPSASLHSDDEVNSAVDAKVRFRPLLRHIPWHPDCNVDGFY